MRRALMGLVVLGLAIVGCSNPAKGEAASLVAAMDRFRAAELISKPGLLPPLQAMPCTDAEVCAAKTACVDHAERLVHGIALKHDVDMRMSGTDAASFDPETRAALIAKLDDASRLLDEGHAAQAACDEKTLQLRIKYRL